MRFTFAISALALAGSVSGFLVERQNVPACALTCISTADLGGCAATDNACLCKNQAFVQSTTTCIESTCNGSDLQAAEQFAQATCAAVGVTLTPPASTGSGAPTQTSGSGSSSSTPTTPTSPSSSSSSASSPTTSPNAARANTVPAIAGLAALFAAIAL